MLHRLDEFRNSSAGWLVKGRDGATEYWAFVPHPLPPDLRFDVELVRVLSDADRAMGELAGLGQLSPNEQTLRLISRPLMRREAVLSSKIEGTVTTVAGLYALEAGQLALLGLESAESRDDAEEVLNYVRALVSSRFPTLPRWEHCAVWSKLASYRK